MNMSTATVAFKADTDSIVRQARIIAKHLTAMADELELESRREGDSEEIATP